MRDIHTIREQFPALRSSTVFFENAGGSQVPRQVVERMQRFMFSSYVNSGAAYHESRCVTETVADARTLVAAMFNGAGKGHVIFGPSSSQLLRTLADAYGQVLRAGDEVIIAQSNHEANIGPWLRLERFGVQPRIWPVNRASARCRLEDLDALLNERTRIIAAPHVSNILGEVNDIREIVRRARRVGAKTVIDGVAYASHAAMDVAAWDVDYYVFSAYKVYGPHMAAMWARSDAITGLTGPNHSIIHERDLPRKFELGCLSYEGCAGMLGLGDYLSFLAGRDDGVCDRATIVRAFDEMQILERAPTARLLEFLRTRRTVRILGPSSPGPGRVGTISFVHGSLPSADLARDAGVADLGIRSGHAYAYRLCEALGADPADGVVRVSFVHYNTMEEVERLIQFFEAKI